MIGVLLLALSSLPAPTQLTVVSARGERQVPVRAERGFPAVNADQLGGVLSLQRVTGGSTQAGSATVRVLGQSFEFLIDAGYFRCGDRIYTLAAGPYVARDSLFVPLQWAIEYLPALVERIRYDGVRARLEEVGAAATATVVSPPVRARPEAVATAPRHHVVAIDAGHGGPDGGMTGPIGGPRTLREKDVTLGIARALQRELERRGIGTVMTRDRDTLIALADRGRIAGRRGAEVFVSIHVNAPPNARARSAASARGFETYYLAEARTEDARRVARMENASVQFETTADAPRGDPLSFILNDLAQNEHLRESSRMAEIVQASLGHAHPSPSRGVKQAGFAVLATSYMPAVLVETGFGSNPAEARFLTSSSGQHTLARALADGIVRYLEEYDRRVGAP